MPNCIRLRRRRKRAARASLGLFAALEKREQANFATDYREAFGVRGACSRFWGGATAPKRRQAGRTPNASRKTMNLQALPSVHNF